MIFGVAHAAVEEADYAQNLLSTPSCALAMDLRHAFSQLFRRCSKEPEMLILVLRHKWGCPESQE